jgi:hypothetical protein
MCNKPIVRRLAVGDGNNNNNNNNNNNKSIDQTLIKNETKFVY